MEQREYFWTIENDGEDMELEMADKDRAVSYAEDLFIEDRMNDDVDWKNGDTEERDVIAIRFYYNDDGDRVEVERSDETLCFEYYHGDLKEHGVP